MTINTKAILFDLDDTLLDRSATFALYCSTLIPTLLPDASEQQRRDIHQYMMSTDKNGYCNRRLFFSELVSKWNIPYDADALTQNWFDQFGSDAVPMPGLRVVLQQLSERFKLAMVTNGTVAMQNRKIDSLGIREFFAAIIISEEVGIRKPDERIFQLACRSLDIQPSDAAFVGDNYEKDVQGSFKAGLKAIWLYRGKHPLIMSHAFHHYLSFARDDR